MQMKYWLVFAIPLATGLILKVHEIFPLNVLCTFNLRPVHREMIVSFLCGLVFYNGF